MSLLRVNRDVGSQGTNKVLAWLGRNIPFAAPVGFIWLHLVHLIQPTYAADICVCMVVDY